VCAKRLGTWPSVRSLPRWGTSPTSPGSISRGPPPKLGEMDRGFCVPGALGEWTVRTSRRLLTLYEQRGVRDVPVVRRKALYTATPVW